MTPPTVGRIVHFVTRDREIRPAIVVEVVGDRCSLQVFLKPIERLNEPDYAALAAHSLTGEPGSWHWPDRVIPPAPPQEGAK